eukprot:6194546-Pleurochrysis_carterae.AAC.2
MTGSTVSRATAMGVASLMPRRLGGEWRQRQQAGASAAGSDGPSVTCPVEVERHEWDDGQWERFEFGFNGPRVSLMFDVSFGRPVTVDQIICGHVVSGESQVASRTAGRSALLRHASSHARTHPRTHIPRPAHTHACARAHLHTRGHARVRARRFMATPRALVHVRVLLASCRTHARDPA